MDENEHFHSSAGNDRREALSIFKQLWSAGNPTLHRMYSSWEELEENIDVKSGETDKSEKTHIQPCPYCGTKRKITRPLEGIFPYAKCENCNQSFYIRNNLTVRKLTEEEKVDIPDSWIQIVEDLNKKKVSVVLGLE